MIMKTLHTIYTSFAKRTAIILTLLLTLGVTSVWGAEKTVTLDKTCFNSDANNYQETEGTIEDTSGGEWKVKGYGMVKGTSVTLGKGNANYLQTPNFSGNISKIKVTCSGSYYLQITDNNGNVVCEQQKVSNSPLTFNISGNYTQLKLFSKRQSSTSNAATTITEVVVTYNATPACEYTVQFKPNRGTGTMSDQPFTCDVPQELNANSFSRTGYTFARWNTEADGSGDSYPDEESVTNLAANGETITLFAQWIANKYTVKFNGNGNTGGSMNDQSFTYDIAQNLTANSFEKYGHTFEGWSKTSNGPVAYTDEQLVSNLTSTNTETVTLYAKWTEKALTNYRTSCNETTQLDAPTNLTVTNITSTSVTLSWDEVANAEKYEIVVKKEGNTVKQITADGITCVVTELEANTDYTWCVSAVAEGYINSEATCSSFKTKEELTDNCRWVEIALEDITPEDEIVVTMGNDEIGYALGTEKITNSPKSQAIIITSGMIDINQDFDYSKYNWSISAVTGGYTLQPYGTTDTYLYGVTSYISIGNNTNNIFTIFTSPENGNKCFAYVIGSNAYFLGYGKESNQDAWKQLTSYKSLLASNTLKFYKKTCLPANKFWVDYELANVTCTNTPPPFAN